MIKTKPKKAGRPKGSKVGQMERISCQFDRDMMDAFRALSEQTGKAIPKIVREGGDLIVAQYRAKGFRV